MVRNLVVALVVIIPVALVTALIISTRIEQIAEPEKIKELGLHEVRVKDATDFALMAVAFGVLVALTYVLLSQQWPLAGSMISLAGIIMALILSVAAAFLRPQAGLSGVPEVILLNLIWGVGYGWLLPLVVRNLGSLAVA